MRRFVLLLSCLSLAAGLLVSAQSAGAAESHAHLKARATKYEFSYSLSSFLATRKHYRAQHDHALNWDSDGCSAPAKWLTGYWSAVFARSCTRHDFGYRNFGHGAMLGSDAATKLKIDKRLLSDMRHQCLTNSTPGSCVTAAQAFYGAIRKSGESSTKFYAGTCPSGRFCIFDDTGYQDRRAALAVSHSNLKDVNFGDKTSSVKNTTARAWAIYDDTGYHDRSYCIKPGVNVSSLKPYKFSDKTSSAKRMSSSKCPHGSAVINP